MYPPSKLYPYEWAVVLLFVGSLSLLSLYSWLNATTEMTYELGEEVWLKDPILVLTISGAVKTPGEYQLKRGTSIGDAVQKAEPLEEADLSRLRLEAPIRAKQKINVPFKKKKLRNIAAV